MSATHGTVRYGQATIPFRIAYVSRRTLEIAVHPDASVRVKAPWGADFDAISRRVIKRARWIRKQMDFFRQFEPRTPQRLYVSGETHLYLGRQYRLKIRAGSLESVKLTKGLICLAVKNNRSRADIKSLLDEWYADRAENKFNESFERCWKKFERFSLPKPKLYLRRMKTRWGSLSKDGRLTLNVDLVRASKDCIDYVVMHELCHLKHHDHSPRFYNFLDKVVPDWKKRKERLERGLV